jgi:transcriptional regulator with XRE-family HTH domain
LSSNTYNLFRQHLKSKRKQLGLSLQVLSERSGVSKSLISKIERSEIQPSIKTASNIAEGLGISLSDMFRERADKQVIFHPVTEQFILSGGGHHSRKRVSPITDDTCIEIYHDKINPGLTTDIICHTDASKFILAMDDGLSITAEEIKYTLNKGDCLYIAENVNHKIANESSLQNNFITMHHRL